VHVCVCARWFVCTRMFGLVAFPILQFRMESKVLLGAEPFLGIIDESEADHFTTSEYEYCGDEQKSIVRTGKGAEQGAPQNPTTVASQPQQSATVPGMRSLSDVSSSQRTLRSDRKSQRRTSLSDSFNASFLRSRSSPNGKSSVPNETPAVILNSSAEDHLVEDDVLQAKWQQHISAATAQAFGEIDVVKVLMSIPGSDPLISQAVVKQFRIRSSMQNLETSWRN
jgi:hypothetical protein